MEYITYKNRIAVIENGEEMGEVTFPLTGENTYTINHTYVDDRLRGRGIASELVRRTVAEIERLGGRVEATCSYALLWLSRNKGKDISGESICCPIDANKTNTK